MCGILGALTEPGFPRERFVASLCALEHRGPDDGDVWQDPEAGVSLGHRRLAVIDLTPAGHQPMSSHDGRFVIVFNGEIYNHQDLRAELERERGAIRWRGHSDTETLLEGFAHWGIRETIERTVGMFAFGTWDRRDRELTLGRDRFGEKPMYYGWTKSGFAFGSELSAFRRQPGFDNSVDRDVVSLYLEFGYVPAPYSIYRDIYKLEPGCILVLAAAAAKRRPECAPFAPVAFPGLTIERYWSAVDQTLQGLGDQIEDEERALRLLEETLSEAVSLQQIADVPLGAFLSGGIDSSTIVALMQARASSRVKTFTIGFTEARFNEADHAKAVAKHLGTEHTELYVTPEHARDVIPSLPAIYAEPFADVSQIPTFLVSRLARAHVTVALSGDAGDELFGGYNRYTWGERIWKRMGWLPRPARATLSASILRIPASGWNAVGGNRVPHLAEKAHKLARRIPTIDSVDDFYRGIVSEWGSSTGVVPGSRPLRTVLDGLRDVRLSSMARGMMMRDTLTYLPDDILHKVDRAAMAVSLETRVPFLDHRVAELAWRIPERMKIREGSGKWILRRLLERYVPRTLIDRPKAGFGVPIGEWLRGPLRSWADTLLSTSTVDRVGLLDADLVRRTWEIHLGGRSDHAARLWPVIMLHAWAIKHAE